MRRQLLLAAALVSALTACVDGATKHRVQANAYLRQGDAATAVKECDEGLALKKDDPSLLILKGKALFELDKMDEAKAAYARAVEAANGDNVAEAHLGLGMIASRTGDWKSARAEFETLAKMNPRDEDATSHLNVARACLELKDMPCAIEHAEKAGKLRGNEENVLFTLGTVYLAADKLQEAELTFQHICDVVPGAASCPYGEAMVAARKGEKEKALEKLGAAVDKKLPSPDSIATDPNFASIKDDPQFLALVAKAHGK